MPMRLQLLLGFALVIAVMVGTTWGLAIRTTDAQLAVLISEGNQQEARLMAPAFLEEYNQVGSWEGLQTTLTEQITQQNQFAFQISPIWEQPAIPRGGVLTFNFNERESRPAGNRNQWDNRSQPRPNNAYNIDINLGELAISLSAPREDNLAIEDQVFLVGPMFTRPAETAQAVYLKSPSLEWVAGNLALTQQRAIVVDNNQQVVVDTKGDLLGKTVQPDFAAKGVPLYTAEGEIGTLMITSLDGVYNLEQKAFRTEMRQGILMSGGISAGMALVLALGIAYQITRPVRSLIAATDHLKQGEWGYQVPAQGRHEIGQLAGAFNELSQHLAEQRELRTRLVDDLAHELNTPLSLIRLEMQAMSDGLQSPSEAAEHVQHELTQVAGLVEDLVFLANRDIAPTLNKDWVDLNQVVRSATRRFEGALPPALTLKFDPQPHLPPLYGDADLIGRAVSNLVANAIRHTPQGQIRVQTCHDADRFEIRVQDTGEGIPADHLPHIFDRFYRADSSRARHSGGRGLGLAIVKEIMDQHAGQILVESEEGKGSVFRLVWGNL